MQNRILASASSSSFQMNAKEEEEEEEEEELLKRKQAIDTSGRSVRTPFFSFLLSFIHFIFLSAFELL